MYIAAKENSTAVLKVLLEMSTDANLPNPDGTQATPLFISAANGHTEAQNSCQPLTLRQVTVTPSPDPTASRICMAYTPPAYPPQAPTLQVGLSILNPNPNPNNRGHAPHTPYS